MIEYKVFVVVTNKRNIEMMAGFTKETARVAADVLSQSVADRKECGVKLGNCFGLVQKQFDNGEIDELPNIWCSVRSPMGLVVQAPVPLPFRPAAVVQYGCLLDSDLAVSVLVADLERIASGVAENRSVLKPFLAAEGFQQKVK